MLILRFARKFHLFAALRAIEQSMLCSYLQTTNCKGLNVTKVPKSSNIYIVLKQFCLTAEKLGNEKAHTLKLVVSKTTQN